MKSLSLLLVIAKLSGTVKLPDKGTGSPPDPHPPQLEPTPDFSRLTPHGRTKDNGLSGQVN